MTLTVVIPTLNEELDLPKTLESLSFADEVLIIDSGSTDQTLSIARQFGARVIHYDFIDYSSTRNFADSLVNTDWILSIDADVFVPKDLAKEILKNINDSGLNQSFYIGRQNEIWGKVIKHADWDPKNDCHLRLYKKNSGSWVKGVHETYRSKYPSGILKNFLYHLNYRSVSEFLDKSSHYSQIASNGSKINPLQSVYDFIKRYFYRLGFLDGIHGLFLSYLQGIYYLNVYVRQNSK